MPLVFDGHNLIHAIRKMEPEYEDFSEAALCSLLAQYLRRIKDKGQIVFDGTGPLEKREFFRYRILHVLFSGSATDADSIIEKIIEKSTHPKRLVVISSDRRLRLAARKRRAISVKSESFWINLTDQMQKGKRKVPEPREKLNGISKAEAKMWMKIFGLE